MIDIASLGNTTHIDFQQIYEAMRIVCDIHVMNEVTASFGSSRWVSVPWSNDASGLAVTALSSSAMIELLPDSELIMFQTGSVSSIDRLRRKVTLKGSDAPWHQIWRPGNVAMFQVIRIVEAELAAHLSAGAGER